MTAQGSGGPPRLDFGKHFSRFLGAVPGRLHVAAHSHHPWPDVTFDAQQQAWLDAARLMDDKWDEVFGAVLPEAAAHITGRLGLSDPEAIAFAPSTHSLVVRLLSCLTPPVRILTTDAEFHSFARQAARLEEDGLASAQRVAAEPFVTFPERFAEAAASGGHDLVYLSHVFFNSGYVVPDLAALVAAVPEPEPLVVIDGYHGFMAVPTDLSEVEGRAFYLAGGYKYAMAGEGACFAHCPPGYAERPRDTGWFAGFAELSAGSSGKVGYAPGGARLLGATLDPTGLYRFNAVQHWLDGLGVTVADIHAHVAAIAATVPGRRPSPRAPSAGGGAGPLPDVPPPRSRRRPCCPPRRRRDRRLPRRPPPHRLRPLPRRARRRRAPAPPGHRARMAMSPDAAKRPLRIRIEGTSLPGRTFCEHQNVHVAVQCRSEPVDPVPGDAAEAIFEFAIDVLPTDDGGWDFRGPYVHGKRGERFLYLTWGDCAPGGEFAMFRRAKLHLSCLEPALIKAAAAPDHHLVARLGLTDAKGGPRCASLRPPALSWTAEPHPPDSPRTTASSRQSRTGAARRYEPAFLFRCIPVDERQLRWGRKRAV